MGSVSTPTPYDDVFKTLLNDCTELVIPLINEIFGEKYTGNEHVYFLRNEHFMNRQDADTKEKITDSCLTIQGILDKKYHIECQSTPDGSMIVRMFEYDSQIALDSGELTGHRLRVSFPRSAVLYLRHNSRTPDEMTVGIETPGGNLDYKISVIKIQKYSLDEIFEKELFFLIPFYIFKYEKGFPKYNVDEEKLHKLEQKYQKIREQLEILCESGRLSEYEKCTIIDMSKKVLEHIAVRYVKVQEGVKNVMDGKILDYEAKDILKLGIKRGEISAYIDLIRDGFLSLAEAARRLKMEESELKKYL